MLRNRDILFGVIWTMACNDSSAYQCASFQKQIYQIFETESTEVFSAKDQVSMFSNVAVNNLLKQ